MNILLIGGNKGLGGSLKKKLESYNHNVLALSRSSTPVLDLISSDEDIRAVVLSALDNLAGSLDLLLVASGRGAYLSPLCWGGDVEKLFSANFLGPTAVFRACYKALLRSKGKAIFVSSTAARRPGSGGLSYYGASKAALNSWIMAEGRRAAKHGVAIAGVAPGFFESEMTNDMVPALKTATTKAIPFGRWGDVEEISEFVVSLINQSNWCLAGQVFEISGGA